MLASGRKPSSCANTIGSPRFCAISTGTSCMSNAPSCQARAAFWWLRTA
jgi:hypothetical protein